MELRIDRIQVVVPNAQDVASTWHALLGAEPVRETKLPVEAAHAHVLALGESEVELLEPDGAGAAHDFLQATGGGLYAAGFATPDLSTLAMRLAGEGVAAVASNDRIHLSPEALGIPGLRLVVSKTSQSRRVGCARFLYEVTHLTGDPGATRTRLAALFGLDTKHFVPIRSEEFGYDGTLTRFQPDLLDRIETIHPFDAHKTMGRYFARRGPSLYMAYAESDDTAEIRSRLQEHAPKDWTGPRSAPVPDNLFVHPRALGGVMLGVSRTSFAWTWSGDPSRVVAAPA